MEELRNIDTQTDEIPQVIQSTSISPRQSDVASVQNFDPTDARRLEDWDKLQAELERLRILEIERHEEIMNLKSSFQRKFGQLWHLIHI